RFGPSRSPSCRMKIHRPVRNSLPLLAIAALICLPFVRLQAQERRQRAETAETPAKPSDAANKKDDAKKEEPKGDKKEPKDELSVTTNTVTINGVEIGYKATTGTIVMKDEEGKPHSTVFFVAYTRQGVSATNLAARPVTFSFNGGPGSSSVWLHLGLLGPRRVFLKDDGGLPPPPFKLVNNEYSLLDETDLVFIDPVSTGFSRPAAGEDPKKFHGVEEDLESVGDFIRLYTTRYNRWSSPKFLIGESYGTTRAAGLSGHLEERYGMYLNGIALVSAVLDFSTISFNVGNDLPYALFLPTETATAWYHKKLPVDLQPDLKKALAESEQFAMGDYTKALMQGAALPAAERQATVKTLARLTGLSEDFVDRADLRITAQQFFKELLLNERLTIGRYDTRRTGQDRNSTGSSPEYDPSYTAVLGPFTGAMNDYVRQDLKFESDLPYEILTGKVAPWDYGTARNRYLDVAETLRETMTHNPYLKVFVANGYYDMATPYLATRYTFDHIGLPADLRTNVSMGYYDAGHMMYVNKPSLIQLKKDLANFVHSALPPKGE
ncbi:MAG: peptidase serine carboxypeptidase, partial [Pedosphaera sp.]|nr:peptidase serine carboxypeptidase [Pedosphaera sp.]